jgi:uncharacterized Zn-binding protein involved in type VI secretion
MPAAARLTDTRTTDSQACPSTDPSTHTGGPILRPGEPTVRINGLVAARALDIAECTPVTRLTRIAAGSPKVFWGPQMAARVGDPTFAAGVIIAPCSPNVEVGGPVATLTVSGGTVTLILGGMVINGAPRDVADFYALISREMLTSGTFSREVLGIIDDTAHPVTFNVGRDNAYWVDSFATNAVDLNDIAWFERDVSENYPWVQTQGEIILHFIVERRDRAINANDFDTAHNVPLAAGGAQEQYRADRGQPGRIDSQVRVDDATNPDLATGVYTDDSGNIMNIRRDSSSGQPVPYEIEYQPASPTTASPGETRTTPVGLLAEPIGTDGFDH